MCIRDRQCVLHGYKLYIINTIEIGLDNYKYMNTRHNSISDKYNKCVYTKCNTCVEQLRVINS